MLNVISRIHENMPVAIRQEITRRFERDFKRLGPAERTRLERARSRFVGDLEASRPFRAGLRVMRVAGTDDVREMTWAPDGRATWQYGARDDDGAMVIVWRRVGTHDILRGP